MNLETDTMLKVAQNFLKLPVIIQISLLRFKLICQRVVTLKVNNLLNS